MLDFTSALYLGLRHASGSLRPWAQLTTGAPAALAAPPEAATVAVRLAALTGCERATLAPSTLHLFWDLFGMLSAGAAIYMDAGAYPIARWGIERAWARGVPVHTFPRHDVRSLDRILREKRNERLRPVVVTDGFSPGYGAAAPLAVYLECVRPDRGQLVVDDTQALGILGEAAGPGMPYGSGGGGSLRHCNVSDRDVIMISSLAKGFGAPLAVMAGSRATIARFEARSETRVHCSPPSLAAIRAAEHALDVNDRHGDALRRRLLHNVERFRAGLADRGLASAGGSFPVQTLTLPPAVDPVALDERLRGYGIAAVLQKGRNGTRPFISFIITARHHDREIDRVVDYIAAEAALRRPHQTMWR